MWSANALSRNACNSMTKCRQTVTMGQPILITRLGAIPGSCPPSERLLDLGEYDPRTDTLKVMTNPEERANLLEEARRRFPNRDPLRPNGWGCGPCGVLLSFNDVLVEDEQPQCPSVGEHVGWDAVFPQP